MRVPETALDTTQPCVMYLLYLMYPSLQWRRCYCYVWFMSFYTAETLGSRCRSLMHEVNVRAFLAHAFESGLGH